MRYILSIILSLVSLVSLPKGHSYVASVTNERLGTQRQICSDFLKKRDFQHTYALSEEYLNMAQEAKSAIDEGYAKFTLGASEVFLGQTSKGETHLKEALIIGEKHNESDLIGLALNTLGIYEASVNTNYYLAQHYFLRSMEYDRTEASASSNLANIAALLNDTTGIEYSLRCIEIGKSKGESHYEYSGYQTLAEFDILKEDYNAAQKHLGLAEQIAQKEGYTDIVIKLFQAEVLMKTGKYQSSIELLNSIEDTVHKAQPIYLPRLKTLQGENYRHIGDFHTSNRYLRNALEAAQSYSSHTELEKVYLFIAKNFADLGQYREGLTYLNQAMESLALKSQTELSRLSNERNLTLEVIYEEQKRKEAENRAHNIQIIVLTLFILLIIAASIIWWIIRLMKRRQALYQQIVKQNLELIEAKKEVERSQSHNTGEKDPTNILNDNRENDNRENDNREFPTGETSRSKILFNTLIKLMEKDKIYRDPLLTREEIISRLNTNPTYLTQAIKQFSGKNYSQFINSYRIKEAVEILSDKDKIEIPIKTICTEVGFNSMATFYKIFQSTVGLSPAAYRKSLLHISALKEDEIEE